MNLLLLVLLTTRLREIDKQSIFIPFFFLFFFFNIQTSKTPKQTKSYCKLFAPTYFDNRDLNPKKFTKMSQQFTKAQVAEHKDEKSGMYIIIDTGVYDVASMFFF